MQRVAADKWARQRVIFDIMNEPDAQHLQAGCRFCFAGAAFGRMGSCTDMRPARNPPCCPGARRKRCCCISWPRRVAAVPLGRSEHNHRTK